MHIPLDVSFLNPTSVLLCLDVVLVHALLMPVDGTRVFPEVHVSPAVLAD